MGFFRSDQYNGKPPSDCFFTLFFSDTRSALYGLCRADANIAYDAFRVRYFDIRERREICRMDFSIKEK